jgi:hypothetical protein
MSDSDRYAGGGEHGERRGGCAESIGATGGDVSCGSSSRNSRLKAMEGEAELGIRTCALRKSGRGSESL